MNVKIREITYETRRLDTVHIGDTFELHSGSYIVVGQHNRYTPREQDVMIVNLKNGLLTDVGGHVIVTITTGDLMLHRKEGKAH